MSEDDPRSRRPGQLVLVLDDEDCVRATIEIMLRRSGYEPVSVGTGHEAVAAVRMLRDDGRSVDVAILDLTLSGGESGEEVRRRLAEANPSLRAIATSGDVEHPAMVSPEASGFAARLAKPFRLADLTSTLASVLKHGPGL